MNVERSISAEKSRRYRAAKRQRGFKQIRLWVPDVNAPGFRDQLSADMASIRQSQDEQAVLNSLDALAEETWKGMD